MEPTIPTAVPQPAAQPAATPAAQTAPPQPIDFSKYYSSTGGVAPAGANPPPYAPNTVNQTVDFGGVTWKGQPGGGWTAQTMTGGGGLPGGQEHFDLLGATQAAYNSPAIQAADLASTAAQAELTTRQQALADAQSGINDNPFYSEATRVGKSAKLSEKANADMVVLQNKINQAQGKAASLRADAGIMVNAALGKYNIDNTAYQQQLSQFNNLVSMGGLDNASDTDIANMAAMTGIPTSMIKSIQKVSNAKDNPQEKPQILTSTDSKGNLSILAVDSNGKVVNTTTIPGVGSSSSGSGGGSTMTTKQENQQNLTNLTTDIRNKVTLKSLVEHYGEAISIDKIYQLYATNSPWGAPNETLAEIKSGKYSD